MPRGELCCDSDNTRNQQETVNSAVNIPVLATRERLMIARLREENRKLRAQAETLQEDMEWFFLPLSGCLREHLNYGALLPIGQVAGAKARLI